MIFRSAPDAPPLPPLPIDAVLPALQAALEEGTRAVLVAAPGAGKTTRVPLALLGASWRGENKIIVLEPRRLAARAAARQMARLLGEDVGETVGYRVRLDQKISARTRIEVVTEGIFTRMVLDAPDLQGIAAVLFDEFHERSLEADLGLALALDASALREGLRLVVMSATLDAGRLATLLGGAPVIASEGRSFPVATRYDEAAAGERPEAHMVRALRAALADETGSILAFLPGQAEIGRVATLLTGLPPDVDLAPLHGQLDGAAQDRAIAPALPGRRKLVLATAIAETSLTIEGVRVVVDSGLSRAPDYDPSSGLTRLVTRRVSKAGAEQRRGRAGRIEPGVCIRLWHEGQTAALRPFDPPEMLSADLCALVLTLAAWGVTDRQSLAFPDEPPEPAWIEARALLETLGAIDGAGRITDAGRRMAAMGLHPRLAHMIDAARDTGEALEAALLATLLEERGLGGDDLDLAHRLERLILDRSRRARSAMTLAMRWAGEQRRPDPGVAVGALLAQAYPDRVAQQAGADGRFRLANGRGARLDAAHALARAPFLVVADLGGAGADARVRAAASIDRQTIETLFADRIETETTLFLDGDRRSVRARGRTMLGALVLADRPLPVDDFDAAARLLAETIVRDGLDRLPWNRDQAGLRGRAAYLHRTLGTTWPDLSDAALARDPSWLAEAIEGRLSADAITADDLGRGLDTLLPYVRRAEMDRLLPSHFIAPTGNRFPIDYDAEGGPSVAIRVQELFGLTRHPVVAGGAVALTLVLLSPAQRPIQTTRDLPRFWAGSWRDVARDLKGRYPRHPWPDNPQAAPPTARAKPRGT